MTDHDPGRPFDLQQGRPQPDKTGQGDVAEGTHPSSPTATEGDSPSHGEVEGPLAPQPLPGGLQADGDSEMRPRQDDPRKSDGVEEFKRMQRNVEDSRD